MADSRQLKQRSPAPANIPDARWREYRGCVQASHQNSRAQPMNRQADSSAAHRPSQNL